MAKKTGFYARQFSQAEARDLQAADERGLLDEIALLRVAMRRTIELADGISELPEMVQALKALSAAAGRLAGLPAPPGRPGRTLSLVRPAGEPVDQRRHCRLQPALPADQPAQPGHCRRPESIYPLTGIRRILGVEYPLSAAGPALENPLRQLEHTCPEFLAQAGYYDVVYRPAAGSEVELWLSGVVAGCPAALAADCRFACQADHSYLDDDSDATSLPERHLELVMLYVRWAAFQELASSKSANPDPTSLAMSTLELNAYRAQRLYLAALQEVKRAESESRLVCWKLDSYDRIY